MNSNISSSNLVKKKQKIKLFLIFNVVSFLFWGITKFSKNYSELVFFDVRFVNSPNLMKIESDYKTIDGYINASGFQILFYRFFPKEIFVDASTAEFNNNNNGVIDLLSQRRSLDDQIKGNFLSFENDKLFFKYFKLKSKKVKVNINAEFKFQSGYSSINDFKIEPDSITISGPEHLIKDINYVNTVPVEMDKISKDIEFFAQIINNDLNNINLHPKKVLYKESVKRFTEQDFEIFINVINKPDSIKIKLFPEKVKLTSSHPFELINEIKNVDFELVFDYLKTENAKFESIPIDIIRYPIFSRNIRWTPTTISYLIKK